MNYSKKHRKAIALAKFEKRIDHYKLNPNVITSSIQTNGVLYHYERFNNRPIGKTKLGMLNTNKKLRKWVKNDPRIYGYNVKYAYQYVFRDFVEEYNMLICVEKKPGGIKL